MAQHAIAVNAANSPSLHSAMAQMPTLQAMNSVNQAYSASGLGSCLCNTNVAYHHSYGCLGLPGSGNDNSVVEHCYVGHVGHQSPGAGEPKEYIVLDVQKESRSWNNNGLPFCQENMQLSTEYDYQQTMAQQAAAVNIANSSSAHSAMAQMPTLPVALNMSRNSVNQGYSASGLDSCLGNRNAAYYYSYGSLESPRSGNGNSVVGHSCTSGRKSKKNKLYKNGNSPPKQTHVLNHLRVLRERDYP
ncbi:high mobility group protein B3 [Trichonephila clavipes]|nr:high mobility group protein B3 [Trichonephila clavipes]